jgi:hypothetical protein
MSVGPLGNTNALSGTSQELANQARRASSELKAEFAAGLGEMDADQEASDRDADGRRPWEFRNRQPTGEEVAPTAAEAELGQAASQSKDASGQSGAVLDLLG